jgi:type VI secretion system protein ImpA
MATPSVLDIDRLLQPIPGDSDVGTDLRKDETGNSELRKVKDARGAACRAERKIANALGDPDAMRELEEDRVRPDWHEVLRLSQSVLTDHSKDLEIVAYLIEAALR